MGKITGSPVGLPSESLLQEDLPPNADTRINLEGRPMGSPESKVVRMADLKTDERGALFVTADSEDPRFNQPYVDAREWRDEPADAPVFLGTITTQHGGAAPVKARHLYIHGGFTG